MFTLRAILVTCVCVWGGGMCKCPIMFVVCMQDACLCGEIHFCLVNICATRTQNHSHTHTNAHTFSGNICASSSIMKVSGSNLGGSLHAYLEGIGK